MLNSNQITLINQECDLGSLNNEPVIYSKNNELNKEKCCHEIAGIKLNYCRYGDHSKPLVLVLGGISSNQYAADFLKEDQTIRGWWNGFIGKGKAVDLNLFQVLSIDFYAGTSFDATTQKHLSTHTQAKLLSQLLCDLELDNVEAVIGGSYGGMVALAFAELYPDLLNKLVVLCAADKSSVKSIGLREIQRKIIGLGLDSKKEQEAFSLARSLALLGYKGEDELENRFSKNSSDSAAVRKNLNSYLQYNSDKFAQQYSKTKYLNLSLSIDLHQIDSKKIQTRSLFIGCDTDQIVPIEFIETLSKNITGESKFISIESTYGHDSFLIEVEVITPHIQSFLGDLRKNKTIEVMRSNNSKTLTTKNCPSNINHQPPNREKSYDSNCQ